MRRLIVLVALAGLILVPSAAARPLRPPLIRQVALVNPDGTAVGGLLQRLVDSSRVSTGRYALMITPATCPVVEGTGLPALGCSSGPVDGSPAATPFETSIEPGLTYWNTANTLYFEMGHQFDWHFLTGDDRQYLARAFGLPHWHWRDSPEALAAGEEDGLEGVFAGTYQDCAEGFNDQGQSFTMSGPYAPPPFRVRINVCAYIDRIALRST